MSATMRLAVLGDPLEFTRSPELHRAGLAALGRSGESGAMRTAPDRLGERLRELAAAGYAGVNLTHPFKQTVIGHLASISDDARLARSVNTVGFSDRGWWGETTDGAGFLDWLRALGRDPGAGHVVMFGAGGAARSIALSLMRAGAATLTVVAREAGLEARRADWAGIPRARLVAGAVGARDALAGGATLVVNATPLEGADGPMPAARLPAAACVLDLVYGAEPTEWVRAARARGLAADDGLGLLVFQARRSLALWTGADVPLEPLARAVGWPR